MAYTPVPSSAEDTAHASGDRGIPLLTVRNDAGAAAGLASDDLDYQILQTDHLGRLPVIDVRLNRQMQSIQVLLMEILATLRGNQS